MEHGFIRIAAVTPSITVAGCQKNAAAAIECIARAERDGARLIALPELCLTGCTCGDLLTLDSVTASAMRAFETVLRYTEGRDTLVVLGAPFIIENALYNCAAVLQNGHILGVVPKAEDDKGVFAPAPAVSRAVTLCGQETLFGRHMIFRCRELPSFTFGVIVGEALALSLPEPAEYCATVVCRISASGETVTGPDRRRMLLRMQSLRQSCACVSVNAGQGESTGDAVFSGHNMIVENGRLLSEAAPFGDGYAATEVDVGFLAHERRLTRTEPEADMQIVHFSLAPAATTLSRHISKTPFVPDERASLIERAAEVAAIQAHGLAGRIRHTGAKTLVLGVSGGVDSTLALIACRDALALLGRPVTDILAVTMPCFGTSRRTRGNAELLCEALGVPLRSIDIAPSVSRHLLDIGHAPDMQDAAFENAQARERTQVLMDLANMYGGFVVGTGDLSELALGFATYNGDHMSMYGVNADLPKTLIRGMLLVLADRSEPRLAAVLRDIVSTPVSPELLPGEDGAIAQITENLVGPYELHDFFLYHLIRRGESREKILRLAAHAFSGVYPPETISRWFGVFCTRFFANQFTRSCVPDGPGVGSVTLSPRGGWRMPSDAVPDAME